MKELHDYGMVAERWHNRGKKTYISPSDTIMSPCTQKLSAFKEKRFAKFVLPSFSLTPSSTFSHFTLTLHRLLAYVLPHLKPSETTNRQTARVTKTC